MFSHYELSLAALGLQSSVVVSDREYTLEQTKTFIYVPLQKMFIPLPFSVSRRQLLLGTEFSNAEANP